MVCRANGTRRTAPSAARPLRVFPSRRSAIRRRTTVQRGCVVYGVDVNPRGQVVGVWGGGVLTKHPLNPDPSSTLSFEATNGGQGFSIHLYENVDLSVFGEEGRGPNYGDLDALIAHRNNLQDSLTIIEEAVAAMQGKRAEMTEWKRQVDQKIAELPMPLQQNIEALRQIEACVSEFLQAVAKAESAADQQLAEIDAQPRTRKAAELPSELARRIRELRSQRRKIEDALLDEMTALEDACRTAATPKIKMLQYPLNIDTLMGMEEAALGELVAERVQRLEHDIADRLLQPVTLIRQVGGEAQPVQVILSQEQERLAKELAALEERLAALLQHQIETREQLTRLVTAARTAQARTQDLYRQLAAPIPGIEDELLLQLAETRAAIPATTTAEDDTPTYYGLIFKDGSLDALQHPNGIRKQALLEGDQEIELPGGKITLVGIKEGFADAEPVRFYEDGKFQSGFIAAPVTYQKLGFRPGIFAVHPNGSVRIGILARELELVDGIVAAGRLELHANGNPSRAILAQEQTIGKMKLKRGTRVNFTQDGTPISVELAEDHRFGLTRRHEKGAVINLT